VSGYRFCRSDDVPLLVRAYNECYRVHLPDLPELNVEGFRTAVRTINLWSSSCMVAFTGQDPIAVLLAAKRETENQILAIGVHPDHMRQGHGRHMLGSLSQKMAILGPPMLRVEVPEGRPDWRQFFVACGYRETEAYTDYTREPGPFEGEFPDAVAPITVDQLQRSGAIDRAARRCWDRAPETVVNLGERLSGWAIASEERIEAWLLHDDPSDSERRIVAFESKNADRAELFLRLLFARAIGNGARRVRIPRMHVSEIPEDRLLRWGFTPGSRTLAHVARAAPG